MKPPLVSVIVPTYNCAGILKGCLDSVVGQDYPSLEVLVMDGVSSDETVEVAQSYGNRVRVFSEPDGGIYDAMNKGIAAAQGEWLFFVGADDAFADPQVVSDMMTSAEARDERTLMLYGNVNGVHLGPRYRGETGASEIVHHNVCHQAAFYRRRLFDVESPYELRYRLYADWDLNLRIYLRHPDGPRYVDRVVANYTGGASSTSYDEAFLAERADNIWRYARDGESTRSIRTSLASLYFDEINGAIRARRWSKASHLMGAALRRSPIVSFAFGKLVGKMRKR